MASCSFSPSAVAATVTRAYGLLCALLLVCVGIAHLHNLIDDAFCNSNAGEKCVGPLLVWIEDDDNAIADVNGPAGGFLGSPRWRTYFSLRPETFADVWSPLLFGLLAVAQHFAGTSWAVASGNWIRSALFYSASSRLPYIHTCLPPSSLRRQRTPTTTDSSSSLTPNLSSPPPVFAAIFACFGYSGNFGVAVGFLLVIYAYFACVMSIVAGCSGEEDMASPNLGIQLKKPSEGLITTGATKGDSMA